MNYEYAVMQRVDGVPEGIMYDTTYDSYSKAWDAVYDYQEDGRSYEGYTVGGLNEAKMLVERLERQARTTYDVVRRPVPTDWEDCCE